MNIVSEVSHNTLMEDDFMIEGGERDCNFEVEWVNYRKIIKNEEDLFKILKFYGIDV